MWRIFDVVPGIVWAAICAGLLITSGVSYVRMVHAQGEVVRLEAAADAAKALAAKRAQEQERAAREKERQLQTEVERISHEAEENDRQLRARMVAAGRELARLRDDINRLNSRATPADPEAAAYAREAGVARELLGACAERYSGVAQEADGLRSQVTGLQDYVRSACSTSPH
jgi:chromosome segregation ATPase